MEEEKKNVQQQNNSQPRQSQGQGRRRRRKKHKNGNGQNNHLPATAQAQNQQQTTTPPQNKGSQNAQKQQKQDGKKKNKQQNKQTDEGRKDTYAYVLDGNLYINLTNKCSNGCDFCVRNERASYYGNYLWLRHGDPTVEKVIADVNSLGDLSRFKEVVFCGFGEPTYKVAEMVALCDFFHGKGLKTRLNTNGQGSMINKRDIVPELKGKIDFVNVSLNASCQEKYQKICRSQFKDMAFEGLLDFARQCRKNEIACRFSIVDCIGEEEVEACKRLAESVKIPLYVRKYIADS